jgi:MFS family permease
MPRAVVAGCALGAASGWNLVNVGAIASTTAHAYGVGLATVGLFTTALLLTHVGAQVPGGRATDRLGARRVAIAGLALAGVGSALAMTVPHPAVAIASRAVAGIGTGLAFIAGVAYVRESGASALAQGIFGGIGLGAGGVALAVVPPLETPLGWRAPYWTSLALALAALVFVAATPAGGPARGERPDDAPHRSLLDRDLVRLAVLYAATFGLNVVVANWVVELLGRHGSVSAHAAGAVGSLTLLLGIVSRPLGGWVVRTHPERARDAVAAGLVAGAAGTLALLAAGPPWLAALGAVLLGVGGGVAFAPAFTAAARLRPDAPAAAAGVVNGAALAVALVGTPLVGLTFSLPGEGRIGFGVVAALWVAALALLPRRGALGGS